MSSKPTDWWPMSNTTPRWRRSSPSASEIGTPASRGQLGDPGRGVQRARRSSATVSSVVSRKQAGSGSRASFTRRPVRASSAIRWATTRSSCVVKPVDVVRARARWARNASGAVWMLGSMPAGRDLGQHVGDAAGVVDPVVGGPVGLVDALHDRAALERPVGEGVHGVDVEVVARRGRCAATRARPAPRSAGRPRRRRAAARRRTAGRETPAPSPGARTPRGWPASRARCRPGARGWSRRGARARRRGPRSAPFRPRNTATSSLVVALFT